MVRVTIEMIPHGIEARKRTLGVMEITNDGTGTLEIGNYRGLLHAEYTGKIGRPGQVKNFKRRRQSAWSLVGAFLKQWGHTRHVDEPRTSPCQQIRPTSAGELL